MKVSEFLKKCAYSGNGTIKVRTYSLITVKFTEKDYSVHDLLARFDNNPSQEPFINTVESFCITPEYFQINCRG